MSSRTVSRWENGNNLPDLSLLVELADFYDVEIRELLNGERKKRERKHGSDGKRYPADGCGLQQRGKRKTAEKNTCQFIVGLIALAAAVVITGLGLAETWPYDLIAGLGLGITLGTIIIGAAYTSKHASKLSKICEAKKNKESEQNSLPDADR